MLMYVCMYHHAKYKRCKNGQKRICSLLIIEIFAQEETLIISIVFSYKRATKPVAALVRQPV